MSSAREKKQRNKKIWMLRKKGKSQSFIASKHGLSQQRVSQILSQENDLPVQKLSRFEAELSSSTRRRILSCFENKPTPEELARLGGDNLLKMKNIGRNSLREVAEVLHKLRYIKEVHSWLPAKKKSILKEEKRRSLLLKETDPFLARLPIKIRRALIVRYGANLTPETVAATGRVRLEMTDNIGPMSLKAIAKALHDLGYINDPDRWLAGKK